MLALQVFAEKTTRKKFEIKRTDGVENINITIQDILRQLNEN